MKVPGVFMIILIIGILGSTIAEEEVNTVGNPGESEKDDCVKYGGMNSYTAFITGRQKFFYCTRSLLNQTELEAERAVALSNGKWDAVVKKYCHRLPNIVQCASDFCDFVRPCLDTADKEILASYYNIMSSVTEFLCQNDGSSITSFVNNGGMQCLTSKSGTIQQDCHLDAIDNQVKSAGRTYPWFEVVRQNCTVIQEFETCTVGILRSCESPTSANIVESVFDFFKSRKSCPIIPST